MAGKAKARPGPLREQVRVALERRAAEWVRERATERGVTEADAEGDLATMAGIGGSKPSVRASNLRRVLEGRVGLSWEVADALAEALGVRLSIFLD